MASFFTDYFKGAYRTDPVNDRGLSYRSLIRFMYPSINDDGSIATGTTITLPFFENIDIAESQKARLGKHDILGRNGQMFTFMGAQSRNIKLQFTMTFPHIEKFNIHPISRYISGSGNYYKHQIRRNMKNGLAPTAKAGRAEPSILSSSFGRMKHTTNLMSWWVNVVRTSTLNNGKDPRLGPPLIMLKHGPLYRDAKFICLGYNISFDQDAGYELSPLINRRINVAMDLAEVKFGNDFAPGKDSDTGDALTGWQDLLEYGMMDPDNDNTPVMKERADQLAAAQAQEDDIRKFDALMAERAGGRYLGPTELSSPGGSGPDHPWSSPTGQIPWGYHPGGDRENRY